VNFVTVDSHKKVTKRLINQSSFSQHVGLFHFFTLTANDRGYGHLRFAGVFAVVERQSECGRKTSQLHVSQQVNIGVCYGHGVWLYKSVFLPVRKPNVAKPTSKTPCSFHAKRIFLFLLAKSATLLLA